MNLLLLLKPTQQTSRSIVFIASVSCLLFISTIGFAQFPLAQRQVWDGPYDIKMIAAPNLHAVYQNPNSSLISGRQIKADSVIRYSTMVMSGSLFEINNRYKGASNFNSYDIPVTAVNCTNFNAPCMTGRTGTPDPPDCAIAYDDVPTVNRYVTMTYPDYDTDMSTYSSSMAQLDISSCSEIEAAYLYWTGMFRGSAPTYTLSVPTSSYNGSGDVFNISTASAYSTIRFKRPGGTYQNVTAAAANIKTTTTRYLCVADVTTMLQGTGGGQFWAANIMSYPAEGDGGSTSGWVLVVIFRNPLSPPRRISLWDGLESISVNTQRTFTLTGLQTPSTSNFKSYVGFAALDGENIASQLDAGDTPEGLGFQTNNGGALQDINPFNTDQPHYKLWMDEGHPAKCDRNENIGPDCDEPLWDGNWCTVYDGVSSSHITSYNEVTDKNGNEITRLPNNINTLGLDVHHMKLPNNAIAPGATQATLTVKAGPQGGTTPFLAYVAIERLQPKLEMTKTVNKNTTALSTSITYTLTVKNKGNTASLGGDIIYDTLDVATDYAGGLTSRRYVNGAVTTPAPGVSLLTSALNRLQINLANPIAINDSVQISFNVQVKDYASNVALWDVQCKRTIENTAYIKYNTATSGLLQSKSNSNDCGIGSETKVLVFDAQLDASNVTVLGPYDACTYLSDAVIPHVRTRLVSNGGVSSSVVNDFDIRNSSYVRLDLDDKFSTVPNNTMSFFAIRDFSSSGNCQQIFEVRFSSCVLPVDLLSFNGFKEQRSVILVWTTASEENNKEFIIERSSDGKFFTPIGAVSGNGNSSISRSYRFEDENPLNGDNYYRLRQVDNNGSFTFSNVIVLTNEKADLVIYPNPNQGSFTIHLQAEDQSYTLDIADVNGKIVYANTGELVPQTVELSGLAKGLYIVRFAMEDETVMKKLIVY